MLGPPSRHHRPYSGLSLSSHILTPSLFCTHVRQDLEDPGRVARRHGQLRQRLALAARGYDEDLYGTVYGKEARAQKVGVVRQALRWERLAALAANAYACPWPLSPLCAQLYRRCV